MSELAINANGSLSRISRAVARLEDRGWVTTQAGPSRWPLHAGHADRKRRGGPRRSGTGACRAVNRLVFDALTRVQARQLGIIAGRILNAIDAESDMTSQLRP